MLVNLFSLCQISIKYASKCDQVVAISVGLVSVAVGIGIPVFYESQIDNAVSSLSFSLLPNLDFSYKLCSCASMILLRR